MNSSETRRTVPPARKRHIAVTADVRWFMDRLERCDQERGRSFGPEFHP